MTVRDLNINFDMTRAEQGELSAWADRLAAAEKRLFSGEEPLTGWLQLPTGQAKSEIARIKAVAEQIRSMCQAFVVIGVGGSYLGARAALEMLTHAFQTELSRPDDPRVFFAGHNISGTYQAELTEALSGRDICLCVVSKSGSTVDPGIAFALLRDMLVKKYGREEAAKRIYVVTDSEAGALRAEAEREGYISFAIPRNVGGRYSVLSPVGLLPMAVAGLDIEAALAGGAAVLTSEAQMQAAAQYAAVRNILFEKGKYIEVFEFYEPRLACFGEWLKQLFGESEGKDGKGIFPVAMQCSTELHSIGQFLQQGNPIFFETVLFVETPPADVRVPESAGRLLAGKSMNEINRAAARGAAAAHSKAGTPVITLTVPELSPFVFGQLVCFFEAACALSGYLMGVDPFDQPGVEAYKSEMRHILEHM